MTVEDVIVFAFKFLVFAVFFYILFGMLGIIKVKDENEEPEWTPERYQAYVDFMNERERERLLAEDDLDDGNPNRP